MAAGTLVSIRGANANAGYRNAMVSFPPMRWKPSLREFVGEAEHFD